MSDITKSILAVDDELPITEVIRRKLTHAGYSCVTASNAEDALKILHTQPFALMITDIRMPGMNGVELLQKVRGIYPDMMVVMLTGVSEAETAISSMRQGAFDYILKPFDLDKLVLTIQRALDHRKLVIQNREYRKNLEKKVEERTHQLKQQHKHLRRLHQELMKSFYDAIRVFIGLIELYEPFLGAHVKRVAALSITLAKHFDLPEEQVRTIEMSALLHDIGLVGISPDLMRKNRVHISTEDFDLIKQSPEYGQQVLQSIKRLDSVGKIIRAQHEYYDGSGFPDGLKGEEIPYEARLLAIANAYDAMRFKRDPEQSLSEDQAIRHLRKMRGRQFDPQLVHAFLQVIGSVPDNADEKVGDIHEDGGDRHSTSKTYGSYQYHEYSTVSKPRMQVRSVNLKELKPGMKLARSITAPSGTTLVSQGTVLTELIIDRLQTSSKKFSLHDQVSVYEPQKPPGLLGIV